MPRCLREYTCLPMCWSLGMFPRNGLARGQAEAIGGCASIWQRRLLPTCDLADNDVECGARPTAFEMTLVTWCALPLKGREKGVDTELATAGGAFARRFTNLLCELQLQTGIHHRAELLLEKFAMEHPNLRASYLSREVDDCYFEDPEIPEEARTRPRLQGLAIENDALFEFIAFARGLRCDTVALPSVVNIEETWIETKPDQPFFLRIKLHHSFPASTVLVASTGEGQDAAQEFVGRLRYLRGW